MGIAYGVTTNFQATKGIVQDGLVFNIDPAVKESYVSGSTVRDLTGTQNATLQNEATLNNEKGGCFSLDGTDDYLSLGAIGTILPGYSEFTLSMWIKPNASASTSVRYDLFTPWTNENFFVSIYTSNNLRFYIWDNIYANAYLQYSDFIVNHAGSWKNIFCTYKTGERVLYVDSSVVASSSNATTLRTYEQQHTNIGASRDGTSTFFGEIGPVQVYNRALTAAEVSRNFNVMRHRFGI